MSVGVQQTWVSLNAQAGQLALNLRNDAQAALNLQAYITTLGTDGMAALGAAPADAQQLLDLANLMANIAQVFQGTTAQSGAYDFAAALVPLTGSQ